MNIFHFCTHKQALLFPIVSILLSVLFASCVQNECTEIAMVNARVSFVNAQSPKQDAIVDTLSVIGLDDNGQRIDSILYNKEKRVGHVLLPLRTDANASRYLFIYHLPDSVQEIDTLVLQHDNRPYVISPECGCVVFHTLKEVETTKRKIKESKIVNSQITNIDEVHITLHF